MKKVFQFAVILSLGLVPLAQASEKTQTVVIAVTEDGFEPANIDVKPGVPVVLKVTRKTDSTCATEIEIPGKKIKKKLPLNEEVTIALGKLKKGEIRFGCAMGMMIDGRIFVR